MTSRNTAMLFFTLVVFSACKKESVTEKSLSDNNQTSATTAHFIGEHYGGGVVFLIVGTHGAIAALNDIDPSTWRLGDLTITTGATRTSVGAGKANTLKIIQVQGIELFGYPPYAALACAKYVSGGYKDWVLPSAYDLIAMYNQRSLIGGFKSDNYWSSTEDIYNPDAAYGYDFIHGNEVVTVKSEVFQIRPVRYY